MSIEFGAYLRENRLPTHEAWQAALTAAGVPLAMEPFDPRTQTGFVPCKLDGVECGFEYYFALAEPDQLDDISAIGDRKHLATFRIGSSMDDYNAAIRAAAVLVRVSDAMFDDADGFLHERGTDVFDIIAAEEEAERDRLTRWAAKDATVTDRRCRYCGMPCPIYRKTCKACGKSQSS